MKIWEDQLNDMYDQVAYYAEGWEEGIDMVAAIPTSKEAHDYMTLFTARLPHMFRKFNWVTYKDQIFHIHNYNYDFYHWAIKFNPLSLTITPYQICIHSDDLSPAMIEKLNSNIYQF